MSGQPTKRRGSVSYRSGTSQRIKTATATVLRALGDAFSSGYHKIKVREKSSGSYATTTTSPSGTTSRIAVNKGRHRGSGDELTGRLTQTMLHEIGLHSVPMLGHEAGVSPRTSELRDHRAMYRSGRRESFLEKTRKTFLGLSNEAQKRGFVDEWHTNVTKQMS